MAANKQTKVKEKAPTQFKKSDLIAKAATFGVMPEIVAGALYDKEQATKEETEELIKDFLTKPKKGAK